MSNQKPEWCSSSVSSKREVVLILWNGSKKSVSGWWRVGGENAHHCRCSDALAGAGDGMEWLGWNKRIGLDVASFIILADQHSVE